jgi:hypothetical protein
MKKGLQVKQKDEKASPKHKYHKKGNNIFQLTEKDNYEFAEQYGTGTVPNIL